MSLEATIEAAIVGATSVDMITAMESRIREHHDAGRLTLAEFERSLENAAKRVYYLESIGAEYKVGLRRAYDDHTAERTRHFPRDKDDLNAAMDAAVQREE